MKTKLKAKTIKAAAFIIAVIIAMFSISAVIADDDPAAPQCDDPYIDAQY